MAQRVGDLVAGSAGAGAAVTLAKTGAVALVVGGLIAGPTVVERNARREPRASAVERRAASRPAKVAAVSSMASPTRTPVVRRAASRPLTVQVAAPRRRAARPKTQHRAGVVRRSEPREEVERSAPDENEQRGDEANRPQDTGHGDREDSSGGQQREGTHVVPEETDEHRDGEVATPAATPTADEHHEGSSSDD